MSQHFGLDIDLQPGRLNIHVVPDHLRGSIKLGRVESLVRLYKGGDIDLELVEGCALFPTESAFSTTPTPFKMEYCKDESGRRAT